MALTDTHIKHLKPKATQYRVKDGQGLCLLVMETGAKLWRFRYRFEGRHKEISMGKYPDTPLVLARARVFEARQLVAKGVDPSVERQTQKEGLDVTLKSIAEEAIDSLTHTTENYRALIRARFTKWVYPKLGMRPLRNITSEDLYQILIAIEAQGASETAHRVRGDLGRVWGYAIPRGRGHVILDVTKSLRGVLKPWKKKRYAATYDPRRLGEILNLMANYRGTPVVKIALELTPHLFLRSSELRLGCWEEVDFNALYMTPYGEWVRHPMWRIPKVRTKARSQPDKTDHLVPLSTQVVALLKRLQGISGEGRWMFPQKIDAYRPLSGNTINQCLRGAGVPANEQSNHGFRSTASTLLNELNLNPQAIEMQLYHSIGGIKGVYDQSLKLDERIKMMQRWSDYLEKLQMDAAGRTLLAMA